MPAILELIRIISLHLCKIDIIYTKKAKEINNIADIGLDLCSTLSVIQSRDMRKNQQAEMLERAGVYPA